MQQQQQQGSASPASQLAVLLWTAGELRNSLSRNLFGTTSSPPPLSSTLLCVSLFCKPDASLFNSKLVAQQCRDHTHTPISPDDFSQSSAFTSL